jgi:hypothetical protein
MSETCLKLHLQLLQKLYNISIMLAGCERSFEKRSWDISTALRLGICFTGTSAGGPKMASEKFRE